MDAENKPHVKMMYETSKQLERAHTHTKEVFAKKKKSMPNISNEITLITINYFDYRITKHSVKRKQTEYQKKGEQFAKTFPYKLPKERRRSDEKPAMNSNTTTCFNFLFLSFFE